jgi:hypothetical protein
LAVGPGRACPFRYIGYLSFGEIVVAHLFEGGKRARTGIARRDGEPGLQRDGVGHGVVADLLFAWEFMLELGFQRGWIAETLPHRRADGFPLAGLS